MDKLVKILGKLIFKALPSTRFYKIKATILRFCGYSVSSNSKLVSSFKIMGVDNVEIGDFTFIGHNSTILGANNSKVHIGDYCDISSDVLILTGTHKVDIVGCRIAGEGIYKNVHISNGVWIGARSTILPGVCVGEKSIVAAGSVVVKNVPANVLVAGNPAVIKKKLI